MVFNSGNFTFNNIYSKNLNIYLVSEDTGVLNDYGIPFNIEDADKEITLSFCYASNNETLSWDYDTVLSFLEWMITDDYCEFISEDNEDIIYFLKGVGYDKRFTNDMKGIIDVTFKVLSPFGYKHYIREILSLEKNFDIYNYSNINNSYKPLITLSNISTKEITLKNTTTNKEAFNITGLNKSDIITIDNMMGIIVDSKGNNKLSNSNRKWIELTKGLNTLSIDGVCDIRIEAYYPIMV